MNPFINSIISGTLLGGLSISANAAKPEKPNVILIMTDQQFADAMSCRIGNKYLNTPNMDRLAANGMLFTRAYSPNPLSMPARNSIFTGRYSHETGVTSNYARTRLDPKVFKSMGTYFKEDGYETVYYGKWHLNYDQKDTLTHGFGFYNYIERIGKGVNDGPDAQTSAIASAFLLRKHDRPFLMIVSFLNPHNVCEWSRRLAGRNDRLVCGEIGYPPVIDELPPAPSNLNVQNNEPDGITEIRRAKQDERGGFPVGNFAIEDWRKLLWGYYRMIELVDQEIGKVLKTLSETGQEQNTIIIFTADHGESAGAHKFNQKTIFYDESARVPLIITWKGKTFSGTTDKLVNTGTDILPTLLEFAGISKPEILSGSSLVPLAFNKKIRNWKEYIVCENNERETQEVGGIRLEMEGRMVRTDDFKYCVYNRGNLRESLVDMKNDPLETENLANDPGYRKILLYHREILRAYGKTFNDSLVDIILNDGMKPLPFIKSAVSK